MLHGFRQNQPEALKRGGHAEDGGPPVIGGRVPEAFKGNVGKSQAFRQFFQGGGVRAVSHNVQVPVRQGFSGARPYPQQSVHALDGVVQPADEEDALFLFLRQGRRFNRRDGVGNGRQFFRRRAGSQQPEFLHAAAGKSDDAVIIGRQFPEQAFLQPPRPEPLHGERQCVEQEVPAFSGEGGGAPALVDKMVITQGGVLGAVLHGDQLHGSLLHLGARAEDAPAARDAPLRLVNKHVRLFLPQQFQQVVPLSAAGKAGRKEGEGYGRKVRFPQPVFLTAEQQNPVSGVPQHFSQAMGGALHAALLAQRLVREIDDDVAHGYSCRHSIQRGITFSG